MILMTGYIGVSFTNVNTIACIVGSLDFIYNV